MAVEIVPLLFLPSNSWSTFREHLDVKYCHAVRYQQRPNVHVPSFAHWVLPAEDALLPHNPFVVAQSIFHVPLIISINFIAFLIPTAFQSEGDDNRNKSGVGYHNSCVFRYEINKSPIIKHTLSKIVWSAKVHLYIWLSTNLYINDNTGRAKLLLLRLSQWNVALCGQLITGWLPQCGFSEEICTVVDYLFTWSKRNAEYTVFR